MRKYFDLVLDLLELEDTLGYQEIAGYLEKYATEEILIAHRAAFLLDAYLKLLRGKIEPEEFVLVGDVESAIPLRKKGQTSAEELIKKIKS
ncbi:MAG: hypothetical protein Q4B28_06400 [bacterium]|nr:hypothetical protein [bacterium]